MSLLLEKPSKFEYSIIERETPQDGVLLTVGGVFQRADTKNANGRIYPTEVWKDVLTREDVKERIQSKQMVGMFGHPEDGKTKEEKISHIVTKQELRSDGTIYGEAQILDTPSGKVLETLIRAGSKVGISSRGDGSIEKKGDVAEVQKDYKLETYDFVLKPSTPGAYPGIMESEEDEVLVVQALEGLVNSELPSDRRVPILLESLEILNVLEHANNDRTKSLTEAIKEELDSDPLVTVVANESATTYKWTPKKVVQEDQGMTYPTGTPNPNGPQGSGMNPDLLNWHRTEVQSAVAAAVAPRDQSIAGLKDTVIKVQREHTETKRKLAAAEELINEFQQEVKSLKESGPADETLKKRYEAAVELLDEALKRLPEIGELRRRTGALEGLLEAGISKFREDKVEAAVSEGLVKIPQSKREEVKGLLESCKTPEQVEAMFKALAYGGVREHSREPLPGQGTPLVEGAGNPTTPKTNTAKGRLHERLLKAV